MRAPRSFQIESIATYEITAGQSYINERGYQKEERWITYRLDSVPFSSFTIVLDRPVLTSNA